MEGSGGAASAQGSLAGEGNLMTISAENLQLYLLDSQQLKMPVSPET